MKRPASNLTERYGLDTPEAQERAARIDEQIDVAQAIYDLRTAASLSQQQLAELLGTKRSAISRLEDADYEGHSMAMLRRIAQALGKRVVVGFVDAEPPRREREGRDLAPV